jgi:hypothetical protein
LRTASVRRTVAAALIAGTLGATGGTAQAASQVDDFTGGAHDKTALFGGGVEIAPAFNESFDQAPAPWLTPWRTPSEATTASGGVLQVNEALLDSGSVAGVGSSISFRATLGGQEDQHAGYASGFNDGQWAIFSRKTGSTNIWARTAGGTSAVSQETELPTIPTNAPHDFRIDRTAQGFKFYVDGNLVAEDTDPFTTETLYAQASDLSATVPLTLESMSLRNVTQGVFTSKVFDAGSATVTGIAFTKTIATGLSYETSTSSDGVNWTPFSAGAIQPARYFRYRALLSTTDVAVSPRLTAATVDFTLASTNPGGGGSTPPAGDTKKPRLGMPRDADVTRRGKVKILLTCPDDELFCRVALVFKSGRKTVASKSGKIAGGDSRYITLKLSKAAKKQLAKARKLKVAATLTVIDAAGNKRTSSKKIWLYPI